MKITKEHYAILRTACEQVIANNPNMKREYEEQGLSDKRYRWDVWYMTENMLTFTCNILYKYLDDNHVDTALRSICK